MKLSQKSNIFIMFSLFAFTFNAFSMEPQPDVSHDIQLIKDILLGSTELNPGEQIMFSFTSLPAEDASKIASFLFLNKKADSLEICGRTINSLAQVNRELNTLINNPNFCLKLIKYLAQRFNCSDEIACQSLQTKEAKERSFVQKQFKTVCMSKTFNETKFNNLYKWYKNYVDLNFTYYNDLLEDDMQQTLLMCAQYCLHSASTTKCLLNTQKIMINKTDAAGFTALMRSAQYARESDAVAFICLYPTININQQNPRGDTALGVICNMCQHPDIFKPKNLIVLLAISIDLNLANNAGLTPLQIAIQHNCRTAIDLIQEAMNNET